MAVMEMGRVTKLTLDRIKAAGIETDLPDSVLQAKAQAAVELVERYAPAAPDAVKKEACIRVIAWLIERPAAETRYQSGRFEAEFAPGHLSALRHSGAMALLSPWKKRRGGVI